jgi:hypothetical protein
MSFYTGPAYIGWDPEARRMIRPSDSKSKGRTCHPPVSTALITVSLLVGLLKRRAQAAIGLHTADTAPTETGMDLSVGANGITIALTAIPEPPTWSAVWALVAELFDRVGPSP